MVGSDNTLRSIAWAELFPWLNIFRALRIAFNFRVLILGAAGMLVMLTAWAILGAAFPVSQSPIAAALAPDGGCPWKAIDASVPDQLPWPRFGVAGPVAPRGADPMPHYVKQALDEARTWQSMSVNPIVGVWSQINRPFVTAFSPEVSLGGLLCLFLGSVASLATWAFFGGAIARIVAVQLAADERVGLFSAMRFACRKWLAFFTAPLVPVLGVALSAVPVWLISLLFWLKLGILTAILWPVLLIFGLVMALLLLGLIFSWPLMWATIATEGTDSFDALSRSYAYLFQRPLNYLFYVLVASILGWIGWLVVMYLAASVIGLTYWAASWGAGGETIAAILPGPVEAQGLGHVTALVIRFWVTCVKALAVGFQYGFFFAAAAAVYVLLRRDVDATEMDEVYLDADQSEMAPALAPITADEEGAPVVNDAEKPLSEPALPKDVVEPPDGPRDGL